MNPSVDHRWSKATSEDLIPEDLTSPSQVQDTPPPDNNPHGFSSNPVLEALLPIREGGYGFASAFEISGPAFTHVLVLVLAKAAVSSESVDLGANFRSGSSEYAGD